MLKKSFITLLLLGGLPVFAGELENALNRGDNVFLYLYTSDCGYCTKFTPKYNQLKKTYNGQYSFLKIDAMTPYGNSLMRQYQGSYVPYVLLLNGKKNTGVQLSVSCLMDNACTEQNLKSFRK